MIIVSHYTDPVWVCCDKGMCSPVYTQQDFWILSGQLRVHTKVGMVAKADFSLPGFQQTVCCFIKI